MVARDSDWPRVLLEQIQAPPDGREHPECQAIHLEDAECIQVILVPLDDGAAGHAGVLDRHDLAERQLGQDHAADMLRQMAGKAEDLADEMDQLPAEPAGRVEARLGHANEHFLAGMSVTDRLGKSRG